MTPHSLLYFLARVGGGALTAASLAVFTRILTPAEYGAYALGVTGASMASTLLYQWLVVAVGRFYPAYSDRTGLVVAASRRGFLWASALAVGALLALLALRYPTGATPEFLVLVFLITVAFGRYNLVLQVANARGLPLRYAALSWLKAALTLVAGAGLVLAGGSHTAALVGVLLGLLVPALALDPLRGVAPARTPEVRVLLERLWQYGLPLVATFVGSVTVDYSDRLVIGWLLGVGQVGPYAAVYDLSTQTIGAVTNVLFLAAFPRVLLAFEREGEDAARLKLQTLGRALVVWALPAAVGFSLLARDVAALFLGAAFRGNVEGFMPLLALGIWLAGFKSYYLDAVFQLRHVTIVQAYIAVGMMALNVALNLALIPRFGLTGAAWATMGAFTAGTAASYLAGRRLIRLLPLWSDLAKALAGSAVMALPLILLAGRGGTAWLLAKIGAGAVCYVAIAWVLDLAGVRTSTRVRWGRRGA